MRGRCRGKVAAAAATAVDGGANAARTDACEL
jgi:hypothetical protein